MEIKELESIVEAILFASGEAIELQRIADAIDVELSTTEKILNNLIDRFDAENRGLRVLKLGDSYQLATRSEYAQYIKTALSTRRDSILSAAALEVLAIIAYNQPTTRGFVSQVRGVDCKDVVDKLEEKHLVEECGKLDAPGHPRLYATTPDFLRTFGLNSIEELPKIEAQAESADAVKFEV